MKEFINLVENKFNKRVKKVLCDNSKEYLKKEINDFVKSKGIELLPCSPYVHELNGVVERYKICNGYGQMFDAWSQNSQTILARDYENYCVFK